MWNRCVPLASMCAAFIFGGCVIYTEPADGPPPPPTPPAKAQPGQPAQPGATGTPAKPAKPALRRKGGFRYTPKPATATPTEDNLGTLLVAVTDGTCVITVDGTDKGDVNQVEEKLAPGDHALTCTPAGGTMQSQTATVAVNSVTTAYFSLSNPANTQVSTPVAVTPPVGRPTPQ